MTSFSDENRLLMRMNLFLAGFRSKNGDEVVIVLLLYLAEALLESVIQLLLQIHSLPWSVVEVIFLVGPLTRL